MYPVIKATIEEMQQQLAHQPQLATMFTQCYLNTLETTVSRLEDGSTFVVTGDIPAMWLRDSSAQVNPYLGYRPADDPLYITTRRFVLSKDNPSYFQGEFAHGVGSPHTSTGSIWHIALAMQGLTSTDKQEQVQVLHMLMNTTAGTNYMHESFDPDDPQRFSRPWFAWANSLFREFILHHLGYKP